MNNTEISKKSKESLNVINQQKVELIKIREAVNTFGISDTFIKEKLNRWKARTIKIISENISILESKKFEHLYKPFMNDSSRNSQVNFLKEIDTYKDFLLVMEQEIINHQEDIISFVTHQDSRLQPNELVNKNSVNKRRKKIFISYSKLDYKKKRVLIDILETHFECISVEDKRIPAISLAEKVKGYLDGSYFFVPILSKNSIINQWVNQEIGYAETKKIKVRALIEHEIINNLKGFIHNQMDLSFTFKKGKYKETCIILKRHLLGELIDEEVKLPPRVVPNLSINSELTRESPFNF